MKKHGKRYCPTCGTRLQKRGHTAAGTQRWFCVGCQKSGTRPRPDLTENLLLERFVSWLLGKRSQEELGTSARTWRSQIAACWKVVPPQLLVEEVFEVVLLDGIRIGSKVCLIAKTTTAVLGWVWVGWESSFTWELLFRRFSAPVVAVCDGQKGIMLALSRTWPDTRLQRCLFHVWQNVRVKLTLHPKTEAGQGLLLLVRALWDVDTPEKARKWEENLSAWEQEYGPYLKERTYLESPEKRKRRWWYTHRGLRSAFHQLKKLVNNHQLFTYLEDLVSHPIPRTTNHVEGGINAQLRNLLKLHRGLTQAHRERLVDWYLYSRTKGQKPPRFCR